MLPGAYELYLNKKEYFRQAHYCSYCDHYSEVFGT
jgi:hypothetical protein